MRAFPTKTAQTIAVFAVLALIPEMAPALANYRIVSWSRLSNVLDFVPAATSQATATVIQYPVVAPDELNTFYRSLQSGGITRVLHYGDSPIVGDLISAEMRSGLQGQFGNAGAGFILMSKPWAWYKRRGVQLKSSGWTSYPATGEEPADHHFGIAGVSFTGHSGAKTEVKLATDHHSIEVAYEARPGGGRFRISANGGLLRDVDTNASSREARYAKANVPGSTRQFEVTVTSGTVRLFGMDLYTGRRGVVYSSLGLNGGYISVLSSKVDKAHWQQQLRHYDPHLVIINYGTNESTYADFIPWAYTNDIDEAIRRVKEACPNASILILGPMDRGEKDASGQIATVNGLPRVVLLEEKAARRMHCSFFNTFEAMGGSGTMARWYTAEPRLVNADFIHPTTAGARVVGELIFRALMDAYPADPKKS